MPREPKEKWSHELWRYTSGFLKDHLKGWLLNESESFQKSRMGNSSRGSFDFNKGSWDHLVEMAKHDAGFYRWTKAHILDPYKNLDPQAEETPTKVREIIKCIDRLCSCLCEGRGAENLVWDAPRVVDVPQNALIAYEKSLIGHLTEPEKILFKWETEYANPSRDRIEILNELLSTQDRAMNHEKRRKRWISEEGAEQFREILPDKTAFLAERETARLKAIQDYTHSSTRSHDAKPPRKTQLQSSSRRGQIAWVGKPVDDLLQRNENKIIIHGKRPTMPDIAREIERRHTQEIKGQIKSGFADNISRRIPKSGSIQKHLEKTYHPPERSQPHKNSSQWTVTFVLKTSSI